MQKVPATKNKILLLDPVHPLIRVRFEEYGYQCDYYPDLSGNDLLKIAGDYSGIIVRSKFTVDRNFLDAATNLEFIGRVGAGMENIDVEYARKRGIRCYNSPEGNRDAVGEHAVGMLLALLNHMTRADLQVRQGIWSREENRGIEIMGKTVGIIGYGNMGSAFARRLKGFEANVIAYDKYKKRFSDAFVTEATMEQIFSDTDILSLHVPLTAETRYLVDQDYLNRFKKPVWLVNTSRGQVVKTADLVKNLKSGKVPGAALDVLEFEDASFGFLNSKDPDFAYLAASDRVILTPHIAGWTRESNEKLARILVEKIQKGERLKKLSGD